MKVPIFDLSHVVVVGRPRVSIPLIMKLADHGIPMHLVSRAGRWRGTMYPCRNGHALRRLRQYDLARNADFRLVIAKKLVTAKIQNSRRVLQRLAANRNLSGSREQTDAGNTLLQILHRAEASTVVDELRGCEGIAAAVYFRRLSLFFPENIPFSSRSRRPPLDAANALLSWTYSIVLTEVDSAVRESGLDPCLGFLHGIEYGRPSLSLDLLEPLRSTVCDLMVMNILNHGILKMDDFETRHNGGVYLKTDARKTFFREYERTMHRRFALRQGLPHTDFRRVVREQVRSLLRAMEGRDMGDFFLMP